MANTLLTPSVIAREALRNLYNATVMLPLVHTDYASEFANVGDTVTVRKPALFAVNEFTTTTTIQDATETSVAVKMDKLPDVSFAVTAKDLSLSLDDFSTQFLQPAMEAHAQYVDGLLLSLYADVYNTTGTAGTTPSALSDITNVREKLARAAVPLTERRLVIDPSAENKFLQLPQTIEADKIGDNGTALREAAIGRKFGLDIVSGQNVKTHDNGTVAHSGTFAVNGAVAAGATTMAVDGSTTLTGQWKKGSVFTVAGVTGSYVVTADVTAAANAMAAVAFAPAAPVGGFADNAVITRVSNHTANLGFHRTAFAFVTRPLAAPMGLPSTQSEVVNFNGLGLRVTYAYNWSKKQDEISVDMLCGVKTLDAARAVRLLG